MDYRRVITKEGARNRGPHYSWCRVVHGPEAGSRLCSCGDCWSLGMGSYQSLKKGGIKAFTGGWGPFEEREQGNILTLLSRFLLPLRSPGGRSTLWGYPHQVPELEAKVDKASVEDCQLPSSPDGGGRWAQM